MAKALPKIQKAVLKWISAYILESHWAPTIREMCEHFDWASTHSAVSHLRALEKKGLLERPPRSARAIRITKAGQEALR